MTYLFRACSVVALLAFASVALAIDCPTGCIPAKSPSCEERLARAKRAGCKMPETIRIVDHEVPVDVRVPCPPVQAPIVQRVEVPGPERVVTAVVPAAPKLGGFLTGGFDLEKGLPVGYNVTAGILIPVKTGHLVVLGGPHYLQRDPYDTTCRIGCRDCAAVAPAGTPWRGSVAVGWAW